MRIYYDSKPGAKAKVINTAGSVFMWHPRDEVWEKYTDEVTVDSRSWHQNSDFKATVTRYRKKEGAERKGVHFLNLSKREWDAVNVGKFNKGELCTEAEYYKRQGADDLQAELNILRHNAAELENRIAAKKADVDPEEAPAKPEVKKPTSRARRGPLTKD